MASVEAQKDWRGEARSLEGISTTIPHKGCVVKIVQDLLQNVRSGLSYSGARNITQLQAKSEFIAQSSASQIESNTHILRRGWNDSTQLGSNRNCYTMGSDNFNPLLLIWLHPLSKGEVFRLSYYRYGKEEKKITFADTDKRHAELRLKLRRDGISQVDFFKSMVTGYINNDPNILMYIT